MAKRGEGSGRAPVQSGDMSAGAVVVERQRAPLGHAVVEELRRRILTGEYVPGQRLVEDKLSAEFDVSRMPVRDAIQMLVADGLAMPTGRRGTCVADLSSDFAFELVEVRATLEGLNASLAARHRNPDILARLQEVLARGKAAAVGGTPAELAALNGEYHDLLALAGSNRVLQDVVRSLRVRTELVFKRNSIERAPEDWHEHSMILAAVVDGDEELAALMATRHVYRAAEARLDTPKPSRRVPSAVTASLIAGSRFQTGRRG